jgi:hypothetical protein
MPKKIYIIFGTISILIIIFFITTITSSSQKNENGSVSENKTTNVDKKYSKKQIKMAEKRSDIETDVDEKMQEYILDTESPKNQETYDKAIEMREKDDQKHLKRDVKDLVEQKREIKDLSTETSFTNSKEIEGTYSYNLVYEKDGKTQTETKDGNYTLNTNKDGYFYIKTFE